MTVTIGDTTFDRVDYDVGADVLYLHVGDPANAVDFEETPEGHALRFDGAGQLVGVTLVRVKDILKRNHRLVITVPSRIELEADVLDAAIHAA